MKKELNTPFNSTKLFIHIKGKNRDRESFYFVIVVLEREIVQHGGYLDYRQELIIEIVSQHITHKSLNELDLNLRKRLV